MLIPLTLFCAVFLLAVSVTADDAPITENNPRLATFQAILQVDKPVQGQITGVSSENGTGVDFNVNFYDFPDASAGPFKYHIHQLPVPADGNCSGTAGHLSPYNRNDTPDCDAAVPQTCQPGDLSGKHGAVADSNGSQKNFQVMYWDQYLSTDPQDKSFFGNRSVVVHAANGTRLNCGNFTQQLPADAPGYNNATNATSTTTTSVLAPTEKPTVTELSPTETGGSPRLVTVKDDAAFGLGVLALLLSFV